MDERDEKPNAMSRRSLLGTGSLLGGLMLVGCTTKPEVPPEGDIEAPQREPVPPDQTPRAGVYEFFTRAEAETVDAIAARVIPGDEDDPGAREAGVVVYIDAKLASFEHFAEPTYMQPPFAEGYEGRPPLMSGGAVAVLQEELYRYGYQSGLSPQTIYRDGLPALNRYAEDRFDAPFIDLTEDQQDTVLQVLDAVQQRSEGGSSGGGSGPTNAELDAAEETFGNVSPGSFFSMVRTDTIEGMFADPIYGGNRGLAGWTLIDYPGPQRSYSPQELKTGTDRVPQSLDGMEAMNPGRRHRLSIDPMQKPRRGVKEG